MNSLRIGGDGGDRSSASMKEVATAWKLVAEPLADSYFEDRCASYVEEAGLFFIKSFTCERQMRSSPTPVYPRAFNASSFNSPSVRYIVTTRTHGPHIVTVASARCSTSAYTCVSVGRCPLTTSKPISARACGLLAKLISTKSPSI
jgi:hypothetical protein